MEERGKEGWEKECLRLLCNGRMVQPDCWGVCEPNMATKEIPRLPEIGLPNYPCYTLSLAGSSPWKACVKCVSGFQITGAGALGQ